MEESNEIVNQTENLLLDKIADVNLFKLHIQPDCSLYQGKMGMAIFYFLYAINKQTENYKLFAEKIIDSIYDLV